jgi:hypothetical protein
MSRNFGVTGRSVVGGLDQPSGLHNGAYKTRADSVRPSVNPFEIGSAFLFALVVLFPIAFIGGVCLGYAAYAPEPVEYQARLKAN